MVNTVVFHKKFGRGIITRMEGNGNRFAVQFEEKAILFQCPEAFEQFLTAEDPATQSSMLVKLQQKRTTEKVAMEEEARAKSAMRALAATDKRISSRAGATKLPTHKNIIFKFNYCDGGATKDSIGFNGVCNPQTIRYNIETAHRSWCSYRGCDCMRYLQGYISYAKLCSYMKGGDSVCNESRLLRDWEANMGWDLTTPNGTPRKLPDYVRKNSLCILTTREPDARESDRIVFAVYLVAERYEGDEESAGGVAADPDFRLVLSPDESRKILLWRYHANQKNPSHPRWGSGLTRSMDDHNAAALLSNIVAVKADAKGKAQAKKIYERFCELNSLAVQNPPKASGALSM